MDLRNATISDIGKIAQVELFIEGEHAASIDTLTNRFNMFPQGFFVVEEVNEICGYVESCLWDKNSYETFEEICNFSEHHNSQNKTLYVIYLGVHNNHRRKGFGHLLIRKLQDYAKSQELDKVQLVAGEGFLIDMYSQLGFKVIRELPKFLPYLKGTLMEYDI